MDQFSIDAKVENLGAVLDFVTRKLEAADCPVKLQNQIAVAVEETFVNISHYAYAPGIGTATIHAAVDDGEIIIKFEDTGKPYNPLEKEDPDITASAEDREVGGLGIFMVKKIMDSVDYRRDGNRNILTVRKKNIRRDMG